MGRKDSGTQLFIDSEHGLVVSIHSINIGTGHGEAVSCARDKVGKHTYLAQPLELESIHG